MGTLGTYSDCSGSGRPDIDQVLLLAVVGEIVVVFARPTRPCRSDEVLPRMREHDLCEVTISHRRDGLEGCARKVQARHIVVRPGARVEHRLRRVVGEANAYETGMRSRDQPQT